MDHFLELGREGPRIDRRILAQVEAALAVDPDLGAVFLESELADRLARLVEAGDPKAAAVGQEDVVGRVEIEIGRDIILPRSLALAADLADEFSFGVELAKAGVAPIQNVHRSVLAQADFIRPVDQIALSVVLPADRPFLRIFRLLDAIAGLDRIGDQSDSVGSFRLGGLLVRIAQRLRNSDAP